MKVGIPVWCERVSPVLDTATTLTVVDLDAGGAETERAVAELPLGPLPRRVAAVAALGLDALICGAVSRPLHEMLEASGVRVVPWVSGEVGEVLSAFGAAGALDARFAMPGCGQGGGRGAGRGGRRGGGRRGGRRRTGGGRGEGGGRRRQ